MAKENAIPQIVQDFEVCGRLLLHNIRRRETLLSTGADHTEWVAVSGAAAIAADATDDPLGGCTKLTVTNETSVVRWNKSAFNLNGKSLILRLRIDDITKLDGLSIALYNGANSQSATYITATHPDGEYEAASMRQDVTLHPGDLAGTEINLSNVTEIRLSITAAAAQTVNIYLSRMATIENLKPGKVWASMDGNNIEAVTASLPVFQAHSVPLTWFVSGWYFYDESLPTRPSMAQMKAAHERGVIMASHSYAHDHLEDYTSVDALERGLVKPKLQLKQAGMHSGVNSFAWPYGTYSEAAVLQARRYYRDLVGIRQKINAPWPGAPEWFRFYIADPYGPLSMFQQKFAAVKKHGGIVGIFHHGDDNVAHLDDVLTAAEAAGLEFISLNDLYGPSDGADGRIAEPATDLYRVPFAFVKRREWQIPTTGWLTSVVGGGVAAAMTNTQIYVQTSATASSSSMARTALNSPFGTTNGNVEWGNRDIAFFGFINRQGSDAQCVARLQFKAGTTIGQLAVKGVELEIRNYEIYGAGFDTGRTETGLLYTLTDNTNVPVWIVNVPAKRVEFYIGGVMVGSINTTTAMPAGSSALHAMISIQNGAAGGTNCLFNLARPYAMQE